LEISNLKNINSQLNQSLEDLNKENNEFIAYFDKVFENFSKEMSNIINQTKQNLESIKEHKSIIFLKKIDGEPSFKFTETFSNALKNFPSLSYLISLYDDIINLNSNIKEIFSPITNKLNEIYKELENERFELKSKEEKYQNQINYLQNKVEEYSLQLKNIDNEYKLDMIKLNEEKDKSNYEIKSISNFIGNIYKSFIKKYNKLSLSLGNPQGLKNKEINKDITIKEIIIDFEKIFDYVSGYTLYLNSSKNSFNKNNNEKDSFIKEIEQLKKKVIEYENKEKKIVKDYKNKESELIDEYKKKFENDLIKIKEDLFEENIKLKKELKIKDEELEKITKNYNLLYSQYHLLLGKENAKKFQI
jgi:hypothetical protein